METLSEKEKQELKLHLTEAMEKFIEKETTVDNHWGYIPGNLDKMMSDAAFAVLEAVNELNNYFEENNMLK